MFPWAYHQPCDEDIESLQSCQLLEECEQDLKSLKNYKESIEHVYPNVNNYLEREIFFPSLQTGPVGIILKN